MMLRLPCRSCGMIRNVTSYQRNLPTYTGLCIDCSRRARCNEKNPNWLGGRFKTSEGYILVLLRPDDFFYPMAHIDGYVKEHRLVMAQQLGRCLHPWEQVNHKNGVKDDNRLENLEIQTVGQHSKMHSKGYRDGYIRGLTDGHNTQIALLNLRIAELEHFYQGVGL